MQSGYRNRLLPLPHLHGQTRAGTDTSPFSTEPVWTQLLTYSPTSHRQYLLFWYIAETLPQDLAALSGPYIPPPPFPADLTLQERIAQDPVDWEPPRQDGTGVDADELQYTSRLVPIDMAAKYLTAVQADVVRRGWEAVVERKSMERPDGDSARS